MNSAEKNLIDKFDLKIDALSTKMDLKFDILMSTIAANNANMKLMMDLDRRL